jgi:hypothetical protein
MRYSKNTTFQVLAMITAIERVKPIVSDGIEFYVSNDGSQVGLSQVGLARLCGISEAGLRAMILALSDRSKRRDGSLKSLVGKDLSLDIGSNQQAKIIAAEHAALIIEYYAFESPSRTETAVFSFRKFAQKGIEAWIKEVTGFSAAGDFVALQSSIEQLVSITTKLNDRLVKMEGQTAGYRVASVKLPGLKEWMEAIPADGDELAIEGDEELFTLAEYLKMEKHITFDNSSMIKFSHKVSSVFQTMSAKMPAKKQGTSARGYKAPPVNAYSRADFPLLDVAFKQVVHTL